VTGQNISRAKRDDIRQLHKRGRHLVFQDPASSSTRGCPSASIERALLLMRADEGPEHSATRWSDCSAVSNCSAPIVAASRTSCPGGQKQRVRHRSRHRPWKPLLLIADEPTSALDVSRAGARPRTAAEPPGRCSSPACSSPTTSRGDRRAHPNQIAVMHQGKAGGSGDARRGC
jgi:ABC-type Fe3+/spermidine/putrescine transport system ATPase subunit